MRWWWWWWMIAALWLPVGAPAQDIYEGSSSLLFFTFFDEAKRPVIVDQFTYKMNAQAGPSLLAPVTVNPKEDSGVAFVCNSDKFPSCTSDGDCPAGTFCRTVMQVIPKTANRIVDNSKKPPFETHVVSTVAHWHGLCAGGANDLQSCIDGSGCASPGVCLDVRDITDEYVFPVKNLQFLP